jgi:hypothetical protein
MAHAKTTSSDDAISASHQNKALSPKEEEVAQRVEYLAF